jgi:hypothetical protein
MAFMGVEMPKMLSAKRVLFTLLIISIYFNISLIRSNSNLINAIPFLQKGEKIKYFNLIDMDGRKITSEALEKNVKKLIFIFARPCNVCNKNIVFWNKIAEILGDKVTCYGIIIDSLSNAYSFFNENRASIKFNVFVPDKIETFIEKNRIKMNAPQTIVYDGSIVFNRIGDLGSEETIKLINSIKNNEKSY